MASRSDREEKDGNSAAAISTTSSQNTLLRITELVIDERLQMRVIGIDDEHADEIAEAVRRKVRLPRIKVRRVDGIGDILTDGHHTVEGHRRAGMRVIPVVLKTGTFEDAVADAAEANRSHLALKRTNADKRRAVSTMLRTFPHWSNLKIAKHVGVSDKTVGEERDRMESTSEIPMLKVREGLDGRVRGPRRETPPPTTSTRPDVHIARRLAEGAHSPNSCPPPDLQQEQASRTRVQTVDWHQFDRNFGWLVRIVDKLAEITGKKDEAEKVHAALSSFLAFADGCRKQLTGKTSMDPPDRER